MKFKMIANEQTPKVERTTEYADTLLIYKRELLVKFISFARRQHNCCGLAANQVSCDGKRVMERFFAIKLDHVWDMIVNPTIVKYSGHKREAVEGCLTWLGKTIVAERYADLDVKYFNMKGEKIERKITGFEAQVWQHEYNHLEGIEENVR